MMLAFIFVRYSITLRIIIKFTSRRFSSVQFSRSVVYDSVWLHGPATREASLSITNYWNLLKLVFIELVMPSNHLILCHPLLLLPSIFPPASGFFSPMIQFFASGGQRSVTISSSPSNEYSGLISFRMYWLDSPWESLRDSQESSTTSQFKSINSLALSFLYSPTLTPIHDYWKNHSLTRWTFVGQSNASAF